MSQSVAYFYQTEAEWLTGKEFKLTSGHLPAIAGGAPPEFQGKEENWSPEQLFVAAVNSCYALTLLAIAEFSKVSIASLSCIARGKLEKTPAGFQVTEVIVKPRITIASVGDLPRMPRILDKARENCFISNSIKSAIRIEPEVFHKQTPVSPCPLGS